MRPASIESADFYQMLDDFLEQTTVHGFTQFTPYVTGGSIRDYFLGNPNFHDLDMTVGVPIEQVEAFLQGKRYVKDVVTVGKAFGVVRVVLKDETNVDIAQFREETYTAGSRKPAVTLVKTIEEDLARRDFTINAMALRYLGCGEFELVDPYNGLRDVQAGIIRAVGNPEERFKEDSLRMLRALRFAVKLRFTIEPVTMAAIQKMRQEVA